MYLLASQIELTADQIAVAVKSLNINAEKVVFDNGGTSTSIIEGGKIKTGLLSADDIQTLAFKTQDAEIEKSLTMGTTGLIQTKDFKSGASFGFMLNGETGQLECNNLVANGGIFKGSIMQGTNFWIATRIVIQKKLNADTWKITCSNSIYEGIYRFSKGIYVIPIPTPDLVRGVPRIITHYCGDKEVSNNGTAPVLSNITSYKPGNTDPQFQINARSGIPLYQFLPDGSQFQYLPLYFSDNNTDGYIDPVYFIGTLMYV